MTDISQCILMKAVHVVLSIKALSVTAVQFLQVFVHLVSEHHGETSCTKHCLL